MDEVKVADYVRMLPEAQAEAAFEGSDHLAWIPDQMRGVCGGPPVEVDQTDAEDDTIVANLDGKRTGLARVPIAACERRGARRLYVLSRGRCGRPSITWSAA